MKVRYSFVSNSSTCSFVVVGMDVSDVMHKLPAEIVEDLYDFCEGHSLDTLYGQEDGLEEGQRVIGLKISQAEDYGLASSTTALSDIVVITERLTELLGITKEPQIFCGTRMC